MDNKTIPKSARYFTDPEKHEVIKELLESRSSKQKICQKYFGKDDKGRLIKWMRRLGYITERYNIVQNPDSMPKRTSTEESFETLQLKKRIAELEQQLKDAELKAIAFSTMVDIAEKEFKIPIRKKLNTKPSKP